MPRKEKRSKKSKREKKPFGETGFGRILSKAGTIGVDVVDIALDVASGNHREAIEKVGIRIKEKAKTDEAAVELAHEFDRLRLTFEKEMYQLEVSDRNSAREREVEVVKSGSKNWTQNALAYIGVGSFFIMTGYLIWRGLPTDMNSDDRFLVGSLTGTVGTIAAGIFSYYFGTSRSSAAKNSMIEKMQQQGKGML